MEIRAFLSSRACVVKEIIADAVVPRHHGFWKILHFQLPSSIVPALQILKRTRPFVTRSPHSIDISPQVRNCITADMNEAQLTEFLQFGHQIVEEDFIVLLHFFIRELLIQETQRPDFQIR